MKYKMCAGGSRLDSLLKLWDLLLLPIRDDGLGIRRVSSLTFPACLASVAVSFPLRAKLSHRIIFISLISIVWKSTTGPTAFRQTVILGQTRNMADKAMVESSLSNEHEKASFLAASAPHSEDCLLALPITACACTPSS